VLHYLDTGLEVDDVLGLVMAERRETATAPWLMLNMVTSVDGATAVNHGSTRLSDGDDRTLFHALRAVPDVILVGAGTVRAEDYRPVKIGDDTMETRRAMGMTSKPRLAIVSGRLDLDADAKVFTDPDNQPVVITRASADPGKIEELSAVAEIVTLPDVDAESIIGSLSSAKVILCEGGPTLNGQLAQAGLVDEINWTISPQLVSGDSKRILCGEVLSPPTRMRLDRALKGEWSLFLRYLRED
jgi:riboflavin-specific deaminase-like protein